jgi:glyoxylase-like metal-dependent hydrolase (beta-lactamase superfamily II)
VPLGDCSIHVRCKDGSPEKAIVIDDGEGKNVEGFIDEAWKRITQKHPGLKLAGWVVTHWDSDHYKGMESWLAKNQTVWDANPFLIAGHQPDVEVNLGVSNRRLGGIQLLLLSYSLYPMLIVPLSTGV